jgi:hypothetical protein
MPKLNTLLNDSAYKLSQLSPAQIEAVEIVFFKNG